MGKVLKCPKCKGVSIEILSEKQRTSVNLNPLHPFTLVNHTPTGKVTCHCTDCGKVFKTKL